MSGQWEVVGKKKEKSTKAAAPQKPGKEQPPKKKNLNLKIEDVLGKSQVKNLYASDRNQENRPVEKVEKKAPDSGPKKPPKKTEKPQEAPKPKPPKSIESALNSIDPEEFKSVFEKSKSQFPDAPIVWLKELAQFLNQKVGVEVADPVFASKPKSYPLNVVPAAIKNVIDRAVRDAGSDNTLLFFNISLTSMATDMGKNLPALGHKLFLQHVALAQPLLPVQNLSKHVDLRNSYQNRPNIGLSILWAVGQVGHSDFPLGLKVFQDLMLPLIEMKNYSRFVVKYLLDLVRDAKDATLTKEQYCLLLDTIYSAKKNFPTDLRQDLIETVPNLKPLLFAKGANSKGSSFVEFILKRIAGGDGKAHRDNLCQVLVESFCREQGTLESWSKVYAKNVSSSAILLSYIDNNWTVCSKQLNKKVLSNILGDFSAVNDELLPKKRKEEGLVQAVATIKKLTEKMTRKDKSGGSSPFRVIFIVVTLAAAAFVYCDVKQQGSWQGSRTRKALQDAGVCEYTHKALDKGKQGLLWVDGHIEATLPGYKEGAADFLDMYVELTRNLGRIIYNISLNLKDVVEVKYPAFVKSVENCLPSLVEQSQNAVNTAWSTSVLYFNRSVDYLRQEVFIGHLSPENVQRVVFEAFNTTQTKATEYYHWLYEKVQTTIK